MAQVARDARALVSAALVVSALVGLVAGRGPLVPIRVSAWTALVCLVLALTCSPVALVLRRLASDRARRAGAAVARARRGVGVAAFVLACLHAGLAVSTHLDFDFGALLAIDRLRHGALALALLTPLALTSSQRVVAALHLRAWKALHRAAYPAAILAVAHASRGPFAPPSAIIAAAAAVAIAVVARPVLALIRGGSERADADPS